MRFHGAPVCRTCDNARHRREYGETRPNYRPRSRDPRYCVRGHERTPENTRVYGIKKFCKDCEKVRQLNRSA